MPHNRRFLGVNSVTNSEPDKGVLPVPIIRNEHWFEKFSFPPSGVPSEPLHRLGSIGAKKPRKASKMRRFPTFENSGYAA